MDQFNKLWSVREFQIDNILMDAEGTQTNWVGIIYNVYIERLIGSGPTRMDQVIIKKIMMDTREGHGKVVGYPLTIGWFL